MSNKPVKSTSISDAIAGKPPTASPRPQSKKKATAKPPQQTTAATQKSSSNYSQNLAERIEAAATKRAQADAVVIQHYGQQVYERKLAQEIQSLMGGDVDSYFRFEIDALQLPQLPTAGYLQTVEVTALPSAN